MGGLGARVCVQGEMAANVMLVTSMVLLMLTQPVFGWSNSDDIDFVTIQDTQDYQECIADPPTCVELCAPFSTSGILSGISVVVFRGLISGKHHRARKEHPNSTHRPSICAYPTHIRPGLNGW